MKRAFCFSIAAFAALGFATSSWAQAGAGGAGAGAGTSGTAGAGASGSAGAGASASGATGTGTTAGATNGVSANNGLGGRNGVGAANGLGTNNGVNTGNNAVNTGATSGARGGLGTNGVGGRTNLNSGGTRSNINPNGSFNNGISQTPFFNNPAIRRQLNLNDTQFNTLNRAYQDAFTNYNNSVNGLGRNLTPDQRNQQMELFENQFNNRFNQSVNSTLNDSRLRSRFDQLNRQYMGLSNFNNPAIQKQLNLTPAQLNQFRQLATSMRSQESNLNPNGTNGQNQFAETWERINSILTPEQRQTWSQLTGERFDFGNNAGSGGGTAQNGFGTGGSQTQNGSTIGNSGTAGDQNTDPSNNLTAPRPGRGLAPTGSTSGTNGAGANSGSATGSGTGTGGNQSSAGSSANGSGDSGTGTGAGTGTGSATGSNSSSK